MEFFIPGLVYARISRDQDIHPHLYYLPYHLLNRHEIDTKAVGELEDHGVILEDVADYINYDLSRDASDYEPSSEDEDVDENIETGKVKVYSMVLNKRVDQINL